MKSRSKILSLFAVCAVALLVLAACGPAETTVAPIEPADTAKPADTAVPEPTVEPIVELPTVLTMPAQIAGGRPVEILTVLKPPDSQAFQLSGWYDQVARFQKLYPNVIIKGTDYAYTPESFAALVAGKQVPDLFEVYLTDPGKMIDQGVAADITDVIKAQGLDKVFNPSVLNISAKDGKYYGLPRFAYVMGIAYNIELLKAAGFDAPAKTWTEFAAQAKTLTNRDAGVAGFSFFASGGGGTGWHQTGIAYNFGLLNTDIVKLENGKYVAGWGNQAVLDSLNYMKQLRWTDDVLPRENLGWDTNAQALATGNAAMIMMAGDQFTWMHTTFPDADINNFGFAPMPTKNAGGKSVSLAGGNIAMVSATATADEQEAALWWKLFIQFDVTEIMRSYNNAKNDPTVIVGAPNLPLYVGDYQEKSAALQAQFANLPIANYAVFMDGITSGSTIVSPEPLVAGQDYYAALGTVVSTILSDANADPAALLREAVATFQTNVLDLLKP